MKRIIFISLVGAVLVASCNHKKQEHANSQQQIEQEQAEPVLNTSWEQKIQLNRGEKWVANQGTTAGIEEMQLLLQSQPTTAIADYHQLAKKLDEVKNNVIKECTMQGPSHDNLHIWLYPLLNKIKALSEATAVEEAAEIKQTIADHLAVYSKYFK